MIYKAKTIKRLKEAASKNFTLSGPCEVVFPNLIFVAAATAAAVATGFCCEMGECNLDLFFELQPARERCEFAFGLGITKVKAKQPKKTTFGACMLLRSRIYRK